MKLEIDAIKHASNQKFSEFETAVKTTLSNKLSDNEVMKAHAAEIANFKDVRAKYVAVNSGEKDDV